ncbi:hypothetical protein AB0N65_01215 [Paenarthrobacter sp. NPDC089322]|uniref:hypothetical protein n=1 Tax=Paenarthrobacter sp. NPDC089322 TaxID=3155065 RepID=UPI00344ABA30
MSRHRFSGVAGGGLLIASLLLVAAIWLTAGPAHASQEEPSGWLELDAGPAGKVHRLTPGGTADWAIGVRVPGEAAGTLEVELQSGTDAPPLLQEFLSVQLRACDQPWAGSSCMGNERTLMEPTPLAKADGLAVDLMEPGTAWSPGTNLLVTAALADAVPREVQGSRATIVVGVRGSGDGGASAPAAGPGLPPSSIASGDNSLADTGARLGGFAVLGVLAVAAGFGLARLRGGS